MTHPEASVRRRELRGEVRFHWGLTATFSAMAAGAALILFDRAEQGPVSFWYLALNLLSGIGFLWLILSHVRAALRASRELSTLRGLPDEE